MADEDPLDRLDYYALLQLERSAPRDAVRAAFHRFAAKFHPDRHAGASLAKRDRAAQVYRRGAEAYKVLTDPAQRRAYDAGLARGRLRFDPQAEPPDEPKAVLSWPLKLRNPAARPFGVKAEQAYKRGDFGEAKVNLRLCASKDPGNPHVEAWLADIAERTRAPAP
jgi:curved DNA-binding protein CbpA